jgi:polyketide cyclase/dehydrase/lipid transport protein
MQGSATVSMSAPADKVWNLIADVRNTGKFSPEVFEAEWLNGATGPALGARFRGHVRRNEIGPVSQRDRPGVLDHLPGHRLRAWPRIRLRRAGRR